MVELLIFQHIEGKGEMFHIFWEAPIQDFFSLGVQSRFYIDFSTSQARILMFKPVLSDYTYRTDQ